MRHWLTLMAWLSLVWLPAASARAHDTPGQLPPPMSAAEAWNVVEQCSANVDQLLATNLPREVGGQLANLSTALRFLNAQAMADGSTAVATLTNTLITGEAELLADSRLASGAADTTAAAWKRWRESLHQLEAAYPPEVVKADVYICPMHPADRHTRSDERCSACGMALVRRHLPASAVYQKPGEPTMKLTATCPPLIVGQPVDVRMHLARVDGSPVRLDDLLEVHTKKIHLLINDASLGDYHHEHPAAADTPGDYTFRFTPTKPGPYRVWADVVPAATGVQEYVIADLPANTAATPIADRETKLSSVVAGRRFDLAIDTASSPLRAGQTYVGTVAVTGEDGKPFDQLEPVMGAFAHLVGFSEDGKTVLHIHPAGKEPTKADDRAGPAFAFKFYCPSPGFLRLYCQVHINGEDVFAPFNLTVAP